MQGKIRTAQKLDWPKSRMNIDKITGERRKDDDRSTGENLEIYS